MKLLKVCFDHLSMFEDGLFEIDLFASDRVTASDESAFELADHLYVNSVVALAGINATGKTTALNLLELACRIVDGSPARGGGLPSTFPAAFDGPSKLKCVIWHADRLYLLESVLQTVEGGDDGPELSFSDEVISSLPAKAFKRSTLASWAEIEKLASPLCDRAQMPDSWAALTPPDVSVAAAVLAKDFGHRIRATALRDGGFRLTEQFNVSTTCFEFSTLASSTSRSGTPVAPSY